MRWLVALLIVGVGLSGCTEGTPENLAQEADTVITDPRDYSYTETDGSGWHVHDYWNNQDELILIEGGTDGCMSCTATYTGERGALLGRFLPPVDHVVPQGTQFVHVLATWDIKDGDHGSIGLFIKTANTTRASFVSFIEENVEVTFESTHDDNDPPHQSLSLWEFEIRALPAPGSDRTTLTDFETTIDVRVERGLEIPAWPEHPDFWNGQTELVLEDSEEEVGYDTQTSLTHFCSNCIGGPFLADGVIVPFDVDSVVVDVYGLDGMPVMFGLMAHGANSRDFTVIEAETVGPNHLRWAIDPEIHYGDSPYAKQTLWEFRLFKDQVNVDDRFEAGHWQGSYRATVTAFKDA